MLNNRQLLQAREEFVELLARSAPEREFQRLFSSCPFILSRSLPLKLLPQQFVSLGRPGKTEPDFVFYPIKGTGFDSYGCIELKRPNQPILTVARKNIAVLSRDAATAVAQANTYSAALSKDLVISADHSLWLGSGPHAFVIIGLTKEFLAKLTDSISSETLREQIGPHCQILPYDELLRRFEQSLPLRIHVLTPAISQNREDNVDSLEQLRIRIENCTQCNLHNSRRSIVFGEGELKARLFFIGESPGRDEDESGVPFSGRAGQYLRKTMSDLLPSDISAFLTNVLKCRPPGNRAPYPDEIATCRSYLEIQIELVSPEVIIALGSTAARWLLGYDLPVSRLVGKWFRYRSIPVRVLHHPAFMLRNRSYESDFIHDLADVAKELEYTG